MTELEKYMQSYFGVANDELEKISSLFKQMNEKQSYQKKIISAVN